MSWACGQLGQRGQVVEAAERRGLVQVERPLGDVHRQVAHALEVGDDLERGGDEAQVGRRRLAQRQDAPAGVVDLHLEPVDLAVARPSPARASSVSRSVSERTLAAMAASTLPPISRSCSRRCRELRLVRLVGVRLAWPSIGLPELAGDVVLGPLLASGW